jgi:geranylgeranyl reductase family protein
LKCDVAIIGTGPAAGAAAGYLATTGLTVVMLEQYALPRAKPCGGLVPEGALVALSHDVSDLVGNLVEHRRYSFQNTLPHASHTPDSALALVDRASFDAGLVQRAISAARGGIVLREGFRVTEVQETETHVEIRGARGQQVTARFTIAADGAASRTARCLALNPRPTNAVGIDTEVRVTDECYHRFADAVLFDYFHLPCGYGWVFPKGDCVLSVGVASWRKGVDCKAAMAGYLSDNFASNDILASIHRAYPIPVYNGQAAIATKRVCLAGDAASLVDPVTGEGIRFALGSGTTAARTICDILANPDEPSDCRLYQQRIYKSIGQSLEPLHRFATLPFREAPEYYYRRFITGGEAKAYQ